MSPKRHARKISYSVSGNLLLGVILCAILALNIAAGVLEKALGLGIDVSSNHIYTLSSATREILQDLDQEIVIYSLTSSSEDTSPLPVLLNRYAAASPKVEVKEVNYATSQSFYQQFETADQSISANSLIITDRTGERFRVLSPSDLFVYSNAYIPTATKAEAKITSAIHYIETGISMRLNFLSGHNETSLSSLSVLKTQLENQNYEVATINLSSAAARKLSPQMDVLVVVSPKTDLSKEEYEAIREFLDKGGRALFLMDHSFFSKSQGRLFLYSNDMPYFDILLKWYNLALNSDVVVGGDPSYSGLRATNFAVTAQKHIITQKLLKNSDPVVFSDASSVSLLDEHEDVALSPLITTPESSHTKSIIKGFSNLLREDGDPSGPFVLGALAERADSKLVLFGTSSFVSNDSLEIAGNDQLILDTLEYISPTDASINIPAHPLRSVQENGSGAGGSLHAVASVGMVFLPLLILLAGCLHIFRRKHL